MTDEELMRAALAEAKLAAAQAPAAPRTPRDLVMFEYPPLR